LPSIEAEIIVIFEWNVYDFRGFSQHRPILSSKRDFVGSLTIQPLCCFGCAILANNQFRCWNLCLNAFRNLNQRPSSDRRKNSPLTVGQNFVNRNRKGIEISQILERSLPEFDFLLRQIEILLESAQNHDSPMFYSCQRFDPATFLLTAAVLGQTFHAGHHAAHAPPSVLCLRIFELICKTVK
jgi:hypothetical protein